MTCSRLLCDESGRRVGDHHEEFSWLMVWKSGRSWRMWMEVGWIARSGIGIYDALEGGCWCLVMLVVVMLVVMMLAYMSVDK